VWSISPRRAGSDGIAPERLPVSGGTFVIREKKSSLFSGIFIISGICGSSWSMKLFSAPLPKTSTLLKPLLISPPE
jgi:hypothetical protein